MKVTVEVIRSLLAYDPQTGKLTWRERPPGEFHSRPFTEAWNTRYAGTEAGFVNADTGYRRVAIFDRGWRAHRIAWIHYYGVFPIGEIDHINGDRDDNRIANLRDVSRRENCKNRARNRTNTSGVFGVCWNKRDQRWRVKIYANGKENYVGNFKEFSEAARARRLAERKFGFHPNHGRDNLRAIKREDAPRERPRW